MGHKAKSQADRTAPTMEEFPRAAQPVLNGLVDRLLEEQSAFRAFLRKRLSDEAVVEDLLQQSLMKVVERHHGLQKNDNAVNWFYRILRNSVVDYYRSRAADNRKMDGLAQDMVASEEDQVPALDEVRPVVCTCLDSLLTEIRPAYADLIRRIDLEGEAPAFVARDLKLTSNNLTVRLHRARQALRATLEKSCGICSKHGCLNCTC